MTAKPVPVMPDKPAETSPEYARLWREYWDYWRVHRNDYRQRADYYKQYRDNITRKRRISKMKQLIDMFPDEAQAHLRAR